MSTQENRKGAISHDGEGQRRNKLVRCGYCSESYERGSSNHKCFLSKRDSVFGNARKRSKTVNVHNVFYFDIESRLEVKYECKFQCMDKKGEMVTLRRSVIINDAKKVDRLRSKLREEESACMVVNECKGHVPTLLCVVNAIGTLKKHFCEKELRYGDPIRHFLLWCAEDIVKKTNSFRGERNDYVFVAHNASGYDTQFVYQAAYDMFGSNNVSVLLHMNRMIELKIQIAMGSRLSTMVFKDSYKFVNLPLWAMPKSGTYEMTMKEESVANRSTMHMERMTRYHPLPNPVYRRRNPVIRFEEEHEEETPVIWREQFDSIRRDFESAFVEGGDTYRIEWMNAFGKYWIKEREWCKDDVEMMRWLMTGANHATVDTCGEHIGSSAMVDYKVIGRRMDKDTFYNPSKLLKQELSMQLPLKSIFKLRRDARKFAGRNRMPVVCGVLDPFYWYYDGYLKCGQICSGREVLLANNKSSFFDECIVQHFHSMTVNAANLRLPSMTFRDIYDLTNDEWNPVTYQHSQMNMSGELMTFAVGGPRFSRNGVLTADNTTNNGLVIGVVRDCRHVALAPLFRYHYELPTNPSAKYINQHMAWLVQMRNQVLRREDPFQDADEYGYIATQLTHLPRLVAFDAGNMLTFGEDPTHLSEEAVNRTFLKDLN